MHPTPLPRQTRLDLLKAGDALLRAAQCDALTGAAKVRRYRDKQRALHREAEQRRRAKARQLGKLGPASPGRRVEVLP